MAISLTGISGNRSDRPHIQVSVRKSPVPLRLPQENELRNSLPLDSEDDTMGDTLTMCEIRRKMRIQSLGGPHPGDGRVSSPSKSADDECEDDEVIAVLALIEADPSSFRREKKQATTRLVSEIFLPPRVTAMLERMSNHGLTPGLALDLTTIDTRHRPPGLHQVVLLAAHQ